MKPKNPTTPPATAPANTRVHCLKMISCTMAQDNKLFLSGKKWSHLGQVIASIAPGIADRVENMRPHIISCSYCLAHVPTAINVDGLARDITITGQHHGDVSNFFNCSKTANWNQFRSGFWISNDHVRSDQRWCN